MPLTSCHFADAFAEIERQDIRVERIYLAQKTFSTLRGGHRLDLFTERRRKGVTETLMWEALVGIDERLKPDEFVLCYRRPPKGSTKPAYLLRKNEGKRFRRRFTLRMLNALAKKERAADKKREEERGL